jgi:uncharacterized protein YqfB (UPF0267 family)
MKYGIRIALVVIIAVLSYFLYDGIQKPIRYAEEVEVKEKAVKEKLLQIREAQLIFNDVNKRFVSTFDSLENFILNGKMEVTIEYGDKDDSTSVYRVEKVVKSIKEEKYPNVSEQEIRSWKYVPGEGDLTFEMEVDMISKNNIIVPVFQITDPKPFSKDRIKAKNPLRVGSIYDINYNGNW